MRPDLDIAMLPMRRLSLITCGLLLTASTMAGEPATPHLRSFDFMGCSGDLGADDDLHADVWRVARDDGVTFLVRHAGTCGMTGRKPTVRGDGHTLTMGYELYSPSGAVAMCDCEYWAAFRFGTEAYGVRRVEFEGSVTRLRGEWPSPP